MAKIKVNISGEAFTGKIVTFKAPCDCTEATGLVIGEDTYDVVDALGNCITGSYLAWRVGAVVSVALDVDSKKAFLQNEKPTPAAIGAAPAGYGLGDGCYGLTSADDVNTVWKTGWYYWGTDVPVNAPVFLGKNQRILMHVQGISKNNFVQEFFCVNDGLKTFARRSYTSGAMGELEYVNPPMSLGVEYRTTERYNGKPVYAKALSVESLEANVVKNVTFAKACDNVIRAYAIGTYNNSNRFTTPRTTDSTFYCDGVCYNLSEARAFMKASVALTDVVAVCYYTKSTD